MQQNNSLFQRYLIFTIQNLEQFKTLVKNEDLKRQADEVINDVDQILGKMYQDPNYFAEEEGAKILFKMKLLTEALDNE